MNGRVKERVFIALGANLGARDEQLERGLALLAEADGVEVVAVSSWFRSVSVGGPPDSPDYWNGVAELRTTLSPQAILAVLLGIERQLGRDRREEVRNGPRVLDLDLLLFGERALDEPGLELPHPRMEQRTFVLAPLAELDASLLLPSGGSVAERLAGLERAGEPRLEVVRKTERA